MAEFNSYLLGKARRSVGNITLCYTRGKNIAKAKVFSRKDNPSPAILAQRARMKTLVQLAHQLLPVIRKGFIGVGKGSSSNAFTSLNMANVLVDEKYVATMNFEQMLCASGLLYTAMVEAAYSTENKIYTFTQEMQDEEDGYAFADDQVYAVLYEEVLKRVRLVTLRARGENGNTTCPLPEGWDNSKVHIYCFATTKNGRMASDSRYLSIG